MDNIIKLRELMGINVELEEVTTADIARLEATIKLMEFRENFIGPRPIFSPDNE